MKLQILAVNGELEFLLGEGQGKPWRGREMQVDEITWKVMVRVR